jgi:hypothetical protein
MIELLRHIVYIIWYIVNTSSMNVQLKTKVLAVFFGDIFFLYLSLFLTLLLRSGGALPYDIIAIHLLPFTIIFSFWLLIFYITGLYDVHRMRNSVDFFSYLFVALLVNIFFAVVLPKPLLSVLQLLFLS